MKGILLALGKAKGAPPSEGMEEAPESEPGGDYKQIAKDAAKDGDWEAFVDAMCAYVDGHK